MVVEIANGSFEAICCKAYLGVSARVREDPVFNILPEECFESTCRGTDEIRHTHTQPPGAMLSTLDTVGCINLIKQSGSGGLPA